MHTTTRLAAPVIRAARARNPAARVCAYGVYAPLNAEWLRSLGVDDVLGGEFEEELTEVARAVHQRRPSSAVRSSFSARHSPDRSTQTRERSTKGLPRTHFLVPDRPGPPPLGRYATLQLGD